MPRNIFALIFTILFCFSSIWAEDGSALWLRYASGAKAEITSKKQSPTLRIAVSELQNFWQGGIPVTLEVRNNKELRALGNEGYTIQTSKGGSQITIASSGEQWSTLWNVSFTPSASYRTTTGISFAIPQYLRTT